VDLNTILPVNSRLLCIYHKTDTHECYWCNPNAAESWTIYEASKVTLRVSVKWTNQREVLGLYDVNSDTIVTLLTGLTLSNITMTGSIGDSDRSFIIVKYGGM